MPSLPKLYEVPLITFFGPTANKLDLPRLTFEVEIAHLKMENLPSNDYLDSLDDPISLFDREIRRLLHTTSQSNPARQLLSVLERCIYYIQNQQRYRNDPRYLRIWLMYASYYPDPLHVFTYLERAEIGRYLCAFYENYASILEQNERPLEAKSVLKTGLRMHAQPISRLQNTMTAFQKKYTESTGSCNRPTLHAPDNLVDPCLYLITTNNRQKYKFPVTFEVHDDRAKRCQLIIEATVFDKHQEEAYSSTSNNRIQQIVRPTKRRLYSETLHHCGERLSFEELRAKQPRYGWRQLLPMVHQQQASAELITKEADKTICSDRSTDIRLPNIRKRLNSDPTGLLTVNIKSKVSGRSDRYELNKSQNDDIQVSVQGSHSLKQFGDQNRYTNEGLPTTERSKGLPSVVDLTELNVEDSSSLSRRPGKRICNTLRPISLPYAIGSSGTAILLNSTMFNMVASQLYSTVQDDGNYYDRRHETMPLKGNLVRLHQRNVKDFVHFMLQLAPYSLSVTGCLAQGGHARVYKAKSLDNTTCALKIQSPAHAYEYCVMKRLVLTLGSTYTQNMVQPMSFHHFRDASCLVMEYCPQGTLLGAINKVRLHATQIGTKTVQGLAEPVVMFLAVRLLQGVVAMHRSGFVHGDIKADNMMLNIQSAPKPKSTKSTATSYTGHDDEYWSLQQVKFIDFGRALDLSAYPSGQKFIAGWQTNKNDDPPQALDHGEWEPWILDYWGLAKVMHCLLFGLHMEVILAGTQNSIRQPMRRWWHTNVWSKLFSVLLNPGRHLPITGTLVDIQHEMEDILVERERNHEKPLSIMISALESMIKE